MARNPSPKSDLISSEQSSFSVGGFSGTVESILEKEDPKLVFEKREVPEFVVKKYQVVNGGRVNMDGMITRMVAGKIVDDVQFDLKKLRDQGIILQELTE